MHGLEIERAKWTACHGDRPEVNRVQRPGKADIRRGGSRAPWRRTGPHSLTLPDVMARDSKHGSRPFTSRSVGLFGHLLSDGKTVTDGDVLPVIAVGHSGSIGQVVVSKS